MQFDYSARTKEMIERVRAFMDEHIYPNEERYAQEVMTGERWKVIEVIEELKPLARAAGLWNMFVPPVHAGAPAIHEFHFDGTPLTNMEYAPLAEEMGKVGWASEVFNCSAPDTGNMEVLARYGTQAQQDRWLAPLSAGEIRSAFLMTEPAVASSDATNIETSITRDGDHYVINGRKWWSSGVGDPRCKVNIVMGKTDPGAPKHLQQSQILVPMDTPGMTKVRPLHVFGYDDAPHGHFEVVMENVRVPVENIILGEGRGFEIAQGRLGPGRIHHCMRSIGASERALEKMCKRLKSRVAFGRPISDQGVWHERIANARIEIEQARLLCLKAAYMMDTVGNKEAKTIIAMIKVVAPNVSTKIIDMAIQAHGGGGVCQDYGLASGYAGQRTLRLADGPDEVHRQAIAKDELRRYN
ncbi:acyl-CoA dehydrogenase family protein [Sandaracinobacteroides saxicola]|uniref:Acyl-CoA dehydrogenase family protein n=1 Tax=Sandaracinobacteroides saxicola TaxID=2759707 RepID=A0A7G5IGC6_9SPHN|nr:acyl-CoA dehydrogenase family protein [Sandaracinobacteroides saxicola]QMW22418.1 acyl-CoA dehydrogenase family protein [Sandaracinobacteroides saxicola]